MMIPPGKRWPAMMLEHSLYSNMTFYETCKDDIYLDHNQYVQIKMMICQSKVENSQLDPQQRSIICAGGGAGVGESVPAHTVCWAEGQH